MLHELSMFIALVFMLLCQLPIMTVQIVWDSLKWCWLKVSMSIQCKINDWRHQKNA